MQCTVYSVQYPVWHVCSPAVFTQLCWSAGWEAAHGSKEVAAGETPKTTTKYVKNTKDLYFVKVELHLTMPKYISAELIIQR